MPGFAARLTLCLRDLPGIADQADYRLLNPARIAARVHYVSPRPARGIDGITGVHLGGSFKEISVLLCKY